MAENNMADIAAAALELEATMRRVEEKIDALRVIVRASAVIPPALASKERGKAQ